MFCWLLEQKPYKHLIGSDKTAPRELAGEPNTAVKGLFSFAIKERLARLNKTGSCSEED